MSKTSIMTLRLPTDVRRGVERLAAQLGYKPAHLSARLVEEGLRRRHFPQIDLRDTAAGRVAYIKGTRLAVHWIVERVRRGMSAAKTATEFNLSPPQVNAALAYAQAFADEIRLDIEETEANRRWLELQEGAWSEGHLSTTEGKRTPKKGK